MKLIGLGVILGIMALSYMSGHNAGYNSAYTFVTTKEQAECKKTVDRILETAK